ncbi:pyridoxal-phosphate dependent enzyme [Enterococcus phoeniculicola]|uniref:threonine ammonia-lyase n=1 Tax=Enterococcus phoeniculicola ATCC BAA-412 TaxID=1158610 RepID=R3W1A3_9ENTE|nr:pyridoxal-phosphate dependent enzyme [Enterococcus phoeniculicola]EOL41256.1 threonine ammonia-lyase [Enterococcus phoeniculicola ATCC BAA-412]EOT78606.1 threonine ammonia-lyase [Enterococcus phoeniculicola ATCC BAA-412]
MEPLLDNLQEKRMKETYHRLKPVVIHTPLMPSNTMNALVDGEVYLKLENLQRTGAFKFRGAYNKLAQLTTKQRACGVIACSAGNHAQGVALAASILQIKARIFMPVTAPLTKIEATKAYGAEVVLAGETFDETKELTISEAQTSGEVFVSPFDDESIIYGQGTIGIEIFEDLADVDNIIVPIGGGGLIAGIALAIKQLNPGVKIIGVQSYQVHGMIRSIWSHRLIENRTSRTLADGCDVALAGALTYDLLKDRIDETILVEEKEIEEAIFFLALKEKVVAEGAGALSTAAILSGRVNHLMKGKKTVAVVSGGNIDFTVFKEFL